MKLEDMSLLERTSFLKDEKLKEFKKLVKNYYLTFGWTVEEKEEFFKVTNVLGESRWVLVVSDPKETKLNLSDFKSKIKDNFTITTPEYSFIYNLKGTKAYSLRRETASGITFYHFTSRR